MYSDEIKLFLQKFPAVFKHIRGVYAIDEIPAELKELDCVIINTE